MAYIPDELIFGRVKDVVYGNGEFNNTKARAQMTARDGHNVNDFGAHFVGELFDLLTGELSHICGNFNRV